MFFQTIQSHPLCFLQIHWAPSHSAHSSHAVPLRGAQCCAPIAADPTNLRPQPPSQATEGGCILGVNGLVFPGKITGKLPWSSWENLAGFRWRCSLKRTNGIAAIAFKVLQALVYHTPPLRQPSSKPLVWRNRVREPLQICPACWNLDADNFWGPKPPKHETLAALAGSRWFVKINDPHTELGNISYIYIYMSVCVCVCLYIYNYIHTYMLCV